MITGTIINVGTILLGSCIGVLLKKGIPERINVIIFQALGLFSIFLGITFAFKTDNNYLLILLSLIIGGIIGELLILEKRTEYFGTYIKRKLKNANPKFTEGLVMASMIFSIGSMAIIGPMNEALQGDMTVILTKAMMDGFTSLALAAAFGWGVAFSVIPVFIVQAFFGFTASYLEPFLGENIINELTAVGGLLILGIGISILEIKKINIINLLPAMLVIPLLFWLSSLLPF